MTRMLIIGPPGSGKGTQAERISERLGVVAISTGDIFRANVKGETPLGVEAKKYMDAGDFVPDSVTNKMVRDRLNEDDVEAGFLLDGYPRTTAQVDYLDDILAGATRSSTSCSSSPLTTRNWLPASWAVPRKLAAATTTKALSVTGWTCTTSRPNLWWPSMPNAAS